MRGLLCNLVEVVRHLIRPTIGVTSEPFKYPARIDLGDRR